MCSLLFLRSESPSQVFLIVLQWRLALLNTSEAILGTFWPFVNVSDKVHSILIRGMSNHRQQILGTFWPFVNVSDQVHCILIRGMSNHRQQILGTFWPFVNVSDKVHCILIRGMSNLTTSQLLLAQTVHLFEEVPA